MSKFAVFGLGRFGANVARRLYELGHDVLAVDNKESAVRSVEQSVSRGVVGDVTDLAVIESLNLKGVSAVIISMGEGLDVSCLSIVHLRSIGFSNIIVKGYTAEHQLIYTALGAKRVIFPEKEMGYRLAEELAFPNLVDHIKLSEGYEFVEMKLPPSLAGRTLADTKIRNKYSLTVIALRRYTNGNEGKLVVSPGPDERLLATDQLLMIGPMEAIKKIRELG